MQLQDFLGLHVLEAELTNVENGVLHVLVRVRGRVPGLDQVLAESDEGWQTGGSLLVLVDAVDEQLATCFLLGGSTC